MPVDIKPNWAGVEETKEGMVHIAATGSNLTLGQAQDLAINLDRVCQDLEKKQPSPETN